MPSSRPYLLRGLYEWIVDNDCTPHLLVDATLSGVEVPQEFVKDGQIVLNISPNSVVGLELDNRAVSFSARFGGMPRQIYVPMVAIIGIYARENGQGMMFEPEPYEPELEPDPAPSAPSGGRPSLKVVK
jgi:stringent starvation protein B